MKKYFCLSLLLLTSCSSSLKEDDCIELDWKHQGMRDASQGLSQSMFSTYQNNCLEGKSHTTQQRLYSLGYNSGLKNYCNFRTGKLLGESDALLNPNCNLKIFPQFKNGYIQGLKISQKKALQKKGPKRSN